MLHARHFLLVAMVVIVGCTNPSDEQWREVDAARALLHNHDSLEWISATLSRRDYNCSEQTLADGRTKRLDCSLLIARRGLCRYEVWAGRTAGQPESDNDVQAVHACPFRNN